MPTRAEQERMKARRQADEWNAKYEVGQRVRVRRDNGDVVDTVTTRPAGVVGGTAVGWFKDISGCYALQRASPIMTPAALTPPATLLCKIGSVVVHVEEMLSPDGHAFDRIALQSLMDDHEVVTWLKQMRALALIPEKR